MSEDQADHYEVPLLSSVLQGYNTKAQSYEDLTLSKCIEAYSTGFLSSHRNLFLITKHSSNTTYNNTILRTMKVEGANTLPGSWICAGYSLDFMTVLSSLSACDANAQASPVAKGLPWQVTVVGGDEVEISGCKSEKTAENASMVIAIARSREPTLVTLGDALQSFLRIPDPTTIGMCFADQRFVKRERRSVLRTVPGQWKYKRVRRWWTSASKTRWITCNLLCLTVIILGGWLLRSGMERDGEYFQTDIISIVSIGFRNLSEATLLANLPQTILSFLYLTYNSLFTCMLSGYELSLFSHHHRTLCVTSPRPGQRSTYWLQIPYNYAIPLMALSGLLHWLTSESIFLARVEMSDPLGKEISATINGLGYSCIAIILVLMLAALALLTPAGMGYRPFAAEITTTGGCSAAISAASHSRGGTWRLL
ncbi:hypothetical protein C7212DRAFT_365968 [Tuber magnatum]|uniref:Uncharacterized protein n=1 Tax=Tuber magnatum TaxID=42249 RepID=A0A317SGN5_9PEZI|nr:hypothetical protein C7212DRAFT_365968 [Tuber magnatum]